jgi:tight adherence protein C
VAERLAALLPAERLAAMRGRFRAAGLHAAWHPAAFLLVRALLAVDGAVLGWHVGGANAWALAIALAAAGALLPEAWLSRRARARVGAIDRALPDALDLLTACVEAGLALDAAIANVAKRPGPATQVLNAELARYLRELNMGVGRADAMRALATRAGSEDLRGVVVALLQGDALGLGIAPVLRAQAKHLRLKRKQRAEERAMRAPVLILFPLLFGLFPAILAMLLGPAMLRLIDALAG